MGEWHEWFCGEEINANGTNGFVVKRSTRMARMGEWHEWFCGKEINANGTNGRTAKMVLW
jgi:hypothetical protein